MSSAAKMHSFTKIDSHQHFWQLKRDDYFWLSKDLVPLYRDYMPEDLLPLLKATNINGTILVQGTDTVAETEFLLNIAKEHKFIFGVVGWVAMDAKKAISDLLKLSENPLFLGIRPMLYNIPDVNWILQDSLAPVFEFLETQGLTFDALAFPRHLKNLHRLALKYPDLKIIIDHAAKPQIKQKQFTDWADDIRAIATCPNVYCKLSGILTEADANCSLDILKPYLDHVFYIFGPKRIMWGSDWPVLNMVSNYQAWYNMIEQYLQPLGSDVRASVLGKTATEFYGVALY